VNCTRLRQVLDAWIDGELDAATSADFDNHLHACPDCRALKGERDALRREIRESAPRHEAPVSLRAAILNRVDAAPAPARLQMRRPVWAGTATIAGIALLAGLLGGYWIARPLPPAEDALREQVVASHVASLSDPQRLIAVQSTDQHVVKPWLQGKIDFAPQVRDLGAQGYTLLGARLDHVGERQSVAIVYRMRNHVINLFSWRAADYAAEAVALKSARGFGMATWAEGGLRYAAVSDIERSDLERFARLVQAP
jgi:anti-sigma factor (TIGR02949 family)